MAAICQWPKQINCSGLLFLERRGAKCTKCNPQNIKNSRKGQAALAALLLIMVRVSWLSRSSWPSLELIGSYWRLPVPSVNRLTFACLAPAQIAVYSPVSSLDWTTKRLETKVLSLYCRTKLAACWLTAAILLGATVFVVIFWWQGFTAKNKKVRPSALPVWEKWLELNYR